MRASDTLKGLAIGLAMTAAATAPAAPLGFYNGMRDTPITKFDKADMALMNKAVYGALDTGADGVKVSWENPDTDSSGSVTPAKDPKGRASCRLAQIENRHKTLVGSGSYIFCKNTKSKTPPWELVAPWTGS
jgi:surface antigen